MALLFFLAIGLLYNAQFFRVVVGAESTDEFLNRKVAYYDDIQWVNENLPDDARLLFYPRRTYYLDGEYIRSTSSLFLETGPGDENWLSERFITPENYLDLLIERGITHIFSAQPNMDHHTNTSAAIEELKSRGNLMSV